MHAKAFLSFLFCDCISIAIVLLLLFLASQLKLVLVLVLVDFGHMHVCIHSCMLYFVADVVVAAFVGGRIDMCYVCVCLAVYLTFI